MPQSAPLVGQCPVCNFHFYNEKEWELHKEICSDENEEGITLGELLEQIPEFAWTPEEMAERDAKKSQSSQVDWEEVNNKIVEYQAREAIKAIQTSQDTAPKVKIVRKSKSVKKTKETTDEFTQTRWNEQHSKDH